LERLWLVQLVREHRDICYQYGVELRPPVFELSHGKKQLGCWLPDRGTIRLSRSLILEHSWNTVLMVLKHEMAHQLCTELLGMRSSGHGPEFRRACARLGVTPPYNRAGGDLAPTIPAPAADDRTEAGRKVIDRISKLLSLAASDNEHEAALAMQRATEIMHRHNLDMAALDDRQLSACCRVTINTGSRQIPGYRRAICAILRDFFYVQVICASQYDPRSDTSHKTIELLGRAENVPVAEHCYHFLEQQLPALWEKNRHRFQGNVRTARNSYYLGVLHGFAEKMAAQGRQGEQPVGKCPGSTAGALIVAQDQGLQEFIGVHFPRLVTKKSRGTRIHAQTFDQAVDTGRRLVLHRTIRERKKGIQGRLDR
jgi:hypothetical protein